MENQKKYIEIECDKVKQNRRKNVINKTGNINYFDMQDCFYENKCLIMYIFCSFVRK